MKEEITLLCQSCGRKSKKAGRFTCRHCGGMLLLDNLKKESGKGKEQMGQVAPDSMQHLSENSGEN